MIKMQNLYKRDSYGFQRQNIIRSDQIKFNTNRARRKTKNIIYDNFKIGNQRKVILTKKFV